MPAGTLPGKVLERMRRLCETRGVGSECDLVGPIRGPEMTASGRRVPYLPRPRAVGIHRARGARIAKNRPNAPEMIRCAFRRLKNKRPTLYARTYSMD